MELELVLNELSLHPPGQDIAAARVMMVDLVDTIRASVKSGCARVLRSHVDINGITLAPSYLVAQWRNDRVVDIEARRYITSLAAKSPLLKDITDKGLLDAISLSDCICDGKRAAGLGLAWQANNLGVSFNSNERWRKSLLNVRVEWLSEKGEIETCDETVRHASLQAHITENDQWIRQRLAKNIRNGVDLWEHKATAFMRLLFCATLRSQIEGLEHTMIIPTIKRLMELDAYAKSWNDGFFDPSKIPTKVTPESDVTLRTYSRERTFLCPDGKMRIFSWHVRLTPGAWRIHFLPLPETRQILVGYIGTKLPTVDSPT